MADDIADVFRQVNTFRPGIPADLSNLHAAQRDMNLTPQEHDLYRRHLGNLWGPGGVTNAGPEPSRSSLYTGVEQHGGQFYNVPTVWNGKREVEPYTRPDGSTLDVPNATALGNVAQAGWNTFPSYATPEQADARYDQMHNYMDRDTGNYFRGR